jgi:hypothetical protein
MIAAIIELQQLGYEVRVDGDHVFLLWCGAAKPPRERVVPLLEDVRRHKVEVLLDLTNTAIIGGIPAASADTRTASSASAAVAHPLEPSSPNVPPTGHDPAPDEDAECCGWCGSTRVWHADTGSGRIYCEACHSVYNPSQARWADGERAKHWRPVP